MYSAHQNHDANTPEPIAELGAQAIARQLADLERMRAAGMELIEQIVAPAPSTSPAPTPEQRALAFTRLARAVRQIIVLEQEVLGLRCPNPRLSGLGYEHRFNDARNLMSEAVANQNDADAVERPGLRDANDLGDANDLREPDDLDDYDDSGNRSAWSVRPYRTQAWRRPKCSRPRPISIPSRHLHRMRQSAAAP